MLEWETVGQPHPHWEVTNRDSPRGNAEDILPEWEGVRRGPKASYFYDFLRSPDQLTN